MPERKYSVGNVRRTVKKKKFLQREGCRESEGQNFETQIWTKMARRFPNTGHPLSCYKSSLYTTLGMKLNTGKVTAVNAPEKLKGSGLPYTIRPWRKVWNSKISWYLLLYAEFVWLNSLPSRWLHTLWALGPVWIWWRRGQAASADINQLVNINNIFCLIWSHRFKIRFQQINC